MTGNQVESHMLSTNGIYPSSCSLLPDVKYALPTIDWVTGDFYRAFESFKFQLNDAQWKSEENDCDDFARFAAFFASYLHHNTPIKAKETALAFGEFWYNQDKGGAHAINVFLYRNTEGVKTGFFEPQNGRVINLSSNEISSCIFYRF